MAKQPAKPRKKATPPPTIKAIKGMGLDMTCKGHLFEVGKSYEVGGGIKACENGFHSCPSDDETSPLAVFEYYAPGTSRYFEVEASGATDRQDSKIASAKITVGVEIGVGELTRRFVEWVMARAKPTKKASNSGDYGAASNSGYQGAASNSGDYGAASNSGDYGAAFSHAFGGKVMCEGDDQALYCTEFDDGGSIKSVACGITGQGKIKAGAWYVCKGGKLVEFKP